MRLVKPCLSTAFLCSTVLSIGASFAEPIPSIVALMQTPISQFSFGMYRLSKEMEGQAESINRLMKAAERSSAFVGDAKFDWETSRIYLLMTSVDPYGRTSEGDFYTQCEIAVNAVRSGGDIELGTGRVSSQAVASSYATFFFPSGSIKPEADPAAAAATLDTLMMIKVRLSNFKQILYECDAPLIGEGYEFHKIP